MEDYRGSCWIDERRCKLDSARPAAQPGAELRSAGQPGAAVPTQTCYQARFTPYASKTSRSVTMPSSLCTSARFTTGRISIRFAPMRSSARSSPWSGWTCGKDSASTSSPSFLSAPSASSCCSLARLRTPITPRRSVTSQLWNLPERASSRASRTSISAGSSWVAVCMTLTTWRSPWRLRVSAEGRWMPSCTASAS